MQLFIIGNLDNPVIRAGDFEDDDAVYFAVRQKQIISRGKQMATISIRDLRPAGADLFDGSESYLQELSDIELLGTNGGSSPFCITLAIGFTLGLLITVIDIATHR
jgi:hypothetical protein